jgi:Domain of unknown function (DUF222)/HNH endonuclease
VDEALGEAMSAVAGLLDRPVWAVSSEHAVEVLVAAQVMVSQLTVVQANLARELNARGWPVQQGATSLGTWLRDRLRISVYAAKRLTDLGAVLDARPSIAAAAGSGAVNPEQVQVIADALAEVPAELGSAVIAECEAVLLAQAQVLEPKALRVVGERMVAHVAPEHADAVLRAKLERDEVRARELRSLTLTPAGAGRVAVRGSLDAESAAIVRAAIEPLCRPLPRPASAAGAGSGSSFGSGSAPASGSAFGSGCDPGSGAACGPEAGAGSGSGLGSDAGLGCDAGSGGSVSCPGCGSGMGVQPCACGADGRGQDLRSPGQRRADALVEVCRLVLACDQLPDNGGSRPQLAVTVNFDVLRRQLGVASLDTGEQLSPATARRLACDAMIIPAVFATTGEVLDLGRRRRLFTGAIRQALVLRDRGCAFPHCDRPPRWTDGHHIVSWVDGGATDLSNGVLLCEHHHRLIHHSPWQVRIRADGLPEFIPPVYVDPLQRPQRNRYHQQQ